MEARIGKGGGGEGREREGSRKGEGGVREGKEEWEGSKE